MIQEKMESIVLDTVEAFGAITEVNIKACYIVTMIVSVVCGTT